MSFYSRSIGWVQLSAHDMADALVLTGSRNGAAKQLGIFNWQFDARGQMVNLHAEKELIRSRLESAWGSHGELYSNLHALIKSMVPAKLDLQLAKALKFGLKDDMVAPLVDTKALFAISGFQIVSKDDADRDKIKKFNKQVRIYPAITLALTHLAATDNVAILYRKNVQAIEILDLGMLTVVPTYTYDKKGNPQFRTFLKLDDEFKKYVNLLLRGGSADRNQKKATVNGIPDKYIAAVRHPRKNDPVHPFGTVELLEKDDEYVYISNVKGVRGRLIPPSMAGVFPSIELRHLLQDGEISISYTIKNFIHQIKMGPKVDNMSLGQALRQPVVSTKDREDALKDYATRTDNVLMEVTDQFLEHVFHFPGGEVDFTKKYGPPDERIRTWAKTSKQIITGSTGNYSGGTIYLKSYRAQIDHMRKVIEELFGEIYEEHVGVKDTIEYEWNKNYLKEPKQVIEEIRMLVDRGMPMEMAAGLLNYNWRLWEQLKSQMLPKDLLDKKDGDDRHEYLQALERPFFEPNQGLLPGGRPRESGDQSDRDNVTQDPRPVDGDAEE